MEKTSEKEDGDLWMRKIRIMFGDEAIQSENADELGLKRQTAPRKALNKHEQITEYIGMDQFHIQELDRVLPSCIQRTAVTECDLPDDYSAIANNLPAVDGTHDTNTGDLKLTEKRRYTIVVDWNAVFDLSDSLKELDPVLLRPMIRRWIHRHYARLCQ